jgi:hypothetical protein
MTVLVPDDIPVLPFTDYHPKSYRYTLRVDTKTVII